MSFPKIRFLIAALCFTLPCVAHERTETDVLHIAQQWFAKQRVSASTPQRVSKTPPPLTPYAQAWCVQQNKQFVLISKTDDMPQVLGYGNAQTDAMPPILKRMLQRQPKAKKYPLDGAKWQPVAPLLKMEHGIYSPFNDLCPYYTYDDGTISTKRCVPGCVAIAMELPTHLHPAGHVKRMDHTPLHH